MFQKLVLMINIKSWSSSFCRHCTGHQSNLSPQFSHRSTWQTQRNHLVLTRQTRLHSEHPSLFCMLLYMTVSLQMTEAYQSKSERITFNHQMASSQVKVFFICSALLCNWTRSETLDLESQDNSFSIICGSCTSTITLKSISSHLD